MRRSIRCLLVGVLVFSLSVDTARACWYLRHARSYAVAVCPPAPACGGWVVVADVAVAGGCDPCCGPAAWQTGHVVVEEIACGTPVACCGEMPAVAAIVNHVEQPPTSVAHGMATAPAAEPIAPPAAVDTVLRQEPTLVLPTDAASKPMAAAPSTPVAPTAPALPELQPVEPASATEPVAPSVPAVEEAKPVSVAPETPAATPEPEAPAPQAPEKPENMEQEPATTTAPAGTPDVTLPDERLPLATEPVVPAEPAATPEPSVAPEPTEPEMKEEAPVAETEPAPAVEEPVEENLFESDGATTPAATQPAAEPAAPVEPTDEPVSEPAAASAESAAEPVADETAASEEEMEEEPGAAPAETPTEPAAESAAPEAGGEEPAADEGVPFSRREPARRWIDSSGRYAVVGVLRAVSDRDAEIVRDDGRTVRVLLERLSEHDRDYAAEAKPRLLAGPRATPRPTDTAGL